MAQFTMVRRVAIAAFLGAFAPALQADEPRPAVIVKIQDETPRVAEVDLPLDPVPRIRLNAKGVNIAINTEAGQSMHLSHFPAFLIDGQMVNPYNGGVQINPIETPLPKTVGGRERIGSMVTFNIRDLKITRTAEIVPSKAVQGQKRSLDAVLIRYQIENKGQQTAKFGFRAYMDCYIINNDGAQFAAPTLPDRVLDGVELKDKTLPDYFQILQVPNLKNPGFVAHMTLNLGSSLEKPTRVVLTRHGMGFGSWEMMPVASTGDSALGIYWETRDLKPGGKREVAYGYGRGIAVPPENEGRFNIALSGSFEPGKLFSIHATVSDPAQGQYLSLDLPAGIERVEGKEMQPVPSEHEQSMVLWKARVLKPGTYRLGIHSSTGLTQTKVISISLP